MPLRNKWFLTMLDQLLLSDFMFSSEVVDIKIFPACSPMLSLSVPQQSSKFLNTDQVGDANSSQQANWWLLLP